MDPQIQETSNPTTLPLEDPQSPASNGAPVEPPYPVDGEAAGHNQDSSTRRVSVGVPGTTYELLRTAAIRLRRSNAEIVAIAITEFMAARSLAPLQGRERGRLRRRGGPTPEQEAEREELARYMDAFWAEMAERPQD